MLTDGSSPIVQLRKWRSPSQRSSLSESVARIVAIWVCRKDRRCLSSSQGSSPSKSVARIVAIWVCRKDCRCLSSLQGSSPSESVARNRHWVKMMDCRKDCRKDGSSQRSLQGSSQGLLLTELHRRRWFGFGSLIAVWVFFFFFLTSLSEMFVNCFEPLNLKDQNGSESARYCV